MKSLTGGYVSLVLDQGRGVCTLGVSCPVVECRKVHPRGRPKVGASSRLFTFLIGAHCSAAFYHPCDCRCLTHSSLTQTLRSHTLASSRHAHEARGAPTATANCCTPRNGTRARTARCAASIRAGPHTHRAARGLVRRARPVAMMRASPCTRSQHPDPRPAVPRQASVRHGAIGVSLEALSCLQMVSFDPTCLSWLVPRPQVVPSPVARRVH